MLRKAADSWTVHDAGRLYEVERWGNGYFSIQPDGHLHVHPHRDPQHGCDLKQLVDQLQLRGLKLPILLRFNDILHDRLDEIHAAFSQTIEEYGYRNKYSCVYPIKVNQQRQVVEEIVRHGTRLGFGLEAGSKPELLAVVAVAEPETPIICNGFKDNEFIEMALLAQKLGRRVLPVVEKFTELDAILQVARRLGVRPRLGMRVKLASRGVGRWHESGGNRSKFGLTISEVLGGLDRLTELGMSDCFELLHFHLGSQVSNIRFLKAALMEAARIYTELVHRGAGLEYLDVGGGLGVDYTGSQTSHDSSINYTLREYAHDVVYQVQSVCDAAGVPHPHLISESGRAVAAYHSVLVFGVVGASGAAQDDRDLDPIPLHAPQPILDLESAYRELAVHNLRETYHDAQQAMETVMSLFNTGHLSLDLRGQAERMYWAVCRKLRGLLDLQDEVPEEMRKLDHELSETYFGNFSLFQSLPDSWAIDHLFPIAPIHRLDQRPTQHVVVGDMTCDSDGKIDRFIERGRHRSTLRLHPYDGSPYYIGAFLVGAYQEILGDLHNLFGDTHAVHLRLSPAGELQVDSIIKGDTVSKVLDYVDFDHRGLVARLQAAVETAVREGHLDHDEAGHWLRFYENSLNGYTYLHHDQEADA